MGVFRQLEARLGRWTERLTARWPGGSLGLSQLSAGLLAQFQASPAPDGQQRLANAFTIRLHPDAHAALADPEGLVRDLLERLRAEATRRRLRWHGRPRVRFESDPAVPLGQPGYSAAVLPGAGPAELQAGERVLRLETAVVLGRAPDCGLRFDRDGVSRHHARFEPLLEGWRVTDLGSTNGTLLNGRRIGAEPLRDGDELCCGPQRFVFRER